MYILFINFSMSSFSDACESEVTIGIITGDHICTNCEVGYEGKKCER